METWGFLFLSPKDISMLILTIILAVVVVALVILVILLVRDFKATKLAILTKALACIDEGIDKAQAVIDEQRESHTEFRQNALQQIMDLEHSCELLYSELERLKVKNSDEPTLF